MSQIGLNQVSDVEMIDSDWRGLCRLGGVATLILLLYSIVTMIVLIRFGTAPSTAIESFAMLQSNRIIGLLRLDLLTVLIYMPLCYILFLGIYAALRRSHGAYALLATLLVFVGITLFLATPSPISLSILSDKYAAATTDAQRSQFLAAGETILASDMWHGTGAFIGGALLETGALLISIVMLKGKIFSKAVAYTGILTHGLDLAHFVFIFLVPGLGATLVPIAGTVYLIWFPLVGLRLFQLGKGKP